MTLRPPEPAPASLSELAMNTTISKFGSIVRLVLIVRLGT